MKPIRNLLMAGILTIAMLAIVPSVDAGSCSENNFGYGWEYPSCTFSCSSNQYISASISGGDGNDYVSAWGNCGGKTASCAEYDGACGSTYPLPTTYSSSNGDCDGSGYDCSVCYISVTVQCWSSSSSSSLIVSKGPATQGLFPVPEEVTSLAQITFNDGVASGLACHQVSPGLLTCAPVHVNDHTDENGLRTFSL